MGKKKSVATALILSVIIIIGLSPMTFGWNNNYVSDNYCVNFDGNMNTYSLNYSYSTYNQGVYPFSGVVEFWDPAPGGWYCPSTHKALCNNAWSSFYYCNGSGYTAASNLNTNCMFTFFGHSNRYSLQLNTSSFLCMDPGHLGGGTGDIGFVSQQNDLDDMAFALLNGCKTAMFDNLNLAWYMRCAKGVDTVIGFDDEISYRKIYNYNGSWVTFYPQNIWNQFFWEYTQRLHWNAGNSEGGADAWVAYHCADQYWGLGTSETWGNKSQYLYSPHGGIIGY